MIQITGREVVLKFMRVKALACFPTLQKALAYISLQLGDI